MFHMFYTSFSSIFHIVFMRFSLANFIFFIVVIIVEWKGIEMKTVYLHIGTPKTGTKALQTFLRRNEGWLNGQGYAYPKLVSSDPRLFQNRNGRFLVDGVKKSEIGIEGFQQLEEVLEQYDKVILSEETLWYYGNEKTDFWLRLVEKLRSLNCEVKTIVYLRRQDELVQSLWNQSIKLRRKCTSPFSQYIKEKEYRYFPLDYYKQLKSIESQMAGEEIIVRVYEKGQYAGSEQSIFSDFLQVVGLEMPRDYIIEGVARNDGLQPEILEMKRIMNGVTEYVKMPDFLAKPIVRTNVNASSRTGYSRGSLFSYEEQMMFLHNYEVSNQKVAIEYLGRNDGMLFYEKIAHQPTYEVDYKTMQEDIIIFMTEAFCEHRKIIMDQQNRIRELERVQNLMYEKSLRGTCARIKNKIVKHNV